jgi:hypothetical protein
MSAPEADFEDFEDFEEQDREDNRIIDCKDWAIRAEKIGGLIAVRGYAIFGDEDEYNPELTSFTEHWWCVDSGRKIVDPTGLRSLADRLVPLAVQDDERPCFAYIDDCDQKVDCAWCQVRGVLERKGYHRVSMAPTRMLLDRLLREQLRLRSEVDALRKEIRRKR